MAESPLRVRNLYNPASKEPYRLSRSKLELFLQCPCCFYLDRRLGLGRVDGPPFTLNIAVDALLKKEFDTYRLEGATHPLMKQFGVNAVPFRHREMETWRDNKKGVSYVHPKTLFHFFGAIDDAWVDPEGTVYVVDYKATGIEGPVSLEGEWKKAYKRQAEIYQWLMRKQNLPVSDTAYFVYVNADKAAASFDGRLNFTMTVLPYEGDDRWVESALIEAWQCLQKDAPPPAGSDCEWCNYRLALRHLGSGEE
jgi:hypothetical protein